MRAEIKWALYCIGLGFSLAVYAHLNFAAKGSVESMARTLERMDARIYQLHLHHGLREKKK